MSKDPEIVKIVLSKGIDVNRIDEYGHACTYYFLDLFDENTTLEIISLFCEKGLDLNIQGTSKSGEKANTILGDFVSSLHKPEKLLLGF